MMLRRRPAAGLAAIVATAALPTYLLVVVRQSSDGRIDDLGLVVAVAGLLLGLASLAAVGALAGDPRVRRASLAIASLGLIVFGFLALWSLGAILLVAGALGLVALIRDRKVAT